VLPPGNRAGGLFIGIDRPDLAGVWVIISGKIGSGNDSNESGGGSWDFGGSELFRENLTAILDPCYTLYGNPEGERK
jgi:hypothetical protein